MPDIKHYFDEEMRYLQKAGQDFAQEHPDAARRLSLGEAEDRDPYVERLLEGFAFLTGRIRQTLDMEDDGLAAACKSSPSRCLDRRAPVAFP
jgi:type VI protein secretion system component VasA